jgi:hypothetical protein
MIGGDEIAATINGDGTVATVGGDGIAVTVGGDKITAVGHAHAMADIQSKTSRAAFSGEGA